MFSPALICVWIGDAMSAYIKYVHIARGSSDPDYPGTRWLIMITVGTCINWALRPRLPKDWSWWPFVRVYSLSSKTQTAQGQGDWSCSPSERVYSLSSKTQTAPGHYDWSCSPSERVYSLSSKTQTAQGQGDWSCSPSVRVYSLSSKTQTAQGQGDWSCSPSVRVYSLSSKTQTAPGHYDWSWSPSVRVYSLSSKTQTAQGQGDWSCSPSVRVYSLSSKTQTARGHWLIMITIGTSACFYWSLQREVRHVNTHVNAKKYTIFRIINYAMRKTVQLYWVGKRSLRKIIFCWHTCHRLLALSWADDASGHFIYKCEVNRNTPPLRLCKCFRKPHVLKLRFWRCLMFVAAWSKCW